MKLTKNEIKECKRLYDIHGYNLEPFSSKWIGRVSYEYKNNQSYNPINKDCIFICKLFNKGVSFYELDDLFESFAIEEIKPNIIKRLKEDIKKFGIDTVKKYFDFKYNIDISKQSESNKQYIIEIFRCIEEHENISSLLNTCYPFGNPNSDKIKMFTILMDMKYLTKEEVKNVIDEVSE